MIRLDPPELDAKSAENLAKWQALVDGAGAYAKRIAAAKAGFKARNTLRNATFNAVKVALTEMCAGGRRCVYCEDSVADEVEHMRPKDIFPEQVFLYENYVYACGNCNGPKNNKYSFVSTKAKPPRLVDLRPKGKGVAQKAPPSLASHVHALIDPRTEDPLELLTLDLATTFTFGPRPRLSAVKRRRAEYTIELLALNSRDFLVRERESAFDDYCNALVAYGQAKTARERQRIKGSVLDKRHPTVWREMQRQSEALPGLAKLFAKAKGAAEW